MPFTKVIRFHFALLLPRVGRGRGDEGFTPVEGVIASTDEVVGAGILDPGEGGGGLFVGFGDAEEGVAEAVGLVLPRTERPRREEGGGVRIGGECLETKERRKRRVRMSYWRLRIS